MSFYSLELYDYSLAAMGSGHGIQGFSFILAPGDVCAVESPQADDGRLFLRALATLVRPLRGSYVFKGQHHDLRRYNDMLGCKRKIGYVSPGVALISNLSVKQNLLLPRYYHENKLDIDLDEPAMALCRAMGIEEKIDQRPAGLTPMEVQSAIIVRELIKMPEILLLDQPEMVVGHSKFDALAGIFNRLIDERLPIVFFSYDERLLSPFVNRKVRIADGRLTAETVPAKPTGTTAEDDAGKR